MDCLQIPKQSLWVQVQFMLASFPAVQGKVFKQPVGGSERDQGTAWWPPNVMLDTVGKVK